MKIEKISLQNFRCFGPEGIEMSLERNLTALVGGNGSGKTALFHALLRLFGPSRSERSIVKRDFHIPSGMEDLPDEQPLVIECILGSPELETENPEEAEDTRAVPEFFNQMAATGPGEPLKVRIRLVARWVDDGTPEGTIEEDIRWILTLDDNFEWDNCPAVKAAERAAIQFIYVPALRNAADRITRLLKGRLWKAALWSEGLDARAREGAELIQRQFEEEPTAKFVIEHIARRWRQVHEADTDTTPKLRLVESRLEDLVRRAEFVFHPDEAGLDRNLADLSDGQRSLFQIALTASVLEIERDALSEKDAPFDQEKIPHVCLTILAIEEPENNLSPFFLSRIMEMVREIGKMSAAQVLVSSHSASILSRIDPQEVRYFRLDRQRRQASIRALTLPENDEQAWAYVRLAVRAYPELYFARFVILAEGESERIVLPRIAEAMGVPLDPSSVPVVPLGGRHVQHFWRLLNDLEIPHATLLDLDLGRSHGGTKTIRKIINQLQNFGRDLSLNLWVTIGDVPLDDQNAPRDEDLDPSNGEDNPWVLVLRDEGVFLSWPLDLDFSMLRAFPEAYQQARPGGRGPEILEEAIARNKRMVLKAEGNLALYEDDEWNDALSWYPYLFLNRSKPDTHLAALSRINAEDLARNAPPELRALINHVKAALYPKPDGE